MLFYLLISFSLLKHAYAFHEIFRQLATTLDSEEARKI